jgi:ketosteroid isomerase-like protein
MKSVDTFAQFVTAINHQDVAAIAALMTPDHLFVDGLGNPMRGATAMKAAWRAYYAMCPDYWIRADQVVADKDIVLAVGEAGGTIDGVAWRTPAAWKAVILGDRVAEWRVFADNKPVYEILAARVKP